MLRSPRVGLRTAGGGRPVADGRWRTAGGGPLLSTSATPPCRASHHQRRCRM